MQLQAEHEKGAETKESRDQGHARVQNQPGAWAPEVAVEGLRPGRGARGRAGCKAALIGTCWKSGEMPMMA